MGCTCACHESEENHDMEDCYCMNDKLRESFERFIDENENSTTPEVRE